MNSLGLRLIGGWLLRGHQGQTNRNILVVWRAGNGIAVAALCEQIDTWPIDQSLSVRRGVCLPVAVRQRQLAVSHGVIELAADDPEPNHGFHRAPVTIL